MGSGAYVARQVRNDSIAGQQAHEILGWEFVLAVGSRSCQKAEQKRAHIVRRWLKSIRPRRQESPGESRK